MKENPLEAVDTFVLAPRMGDSAFVLVNCRREEEVC